MQYFRPIVTSLSDRAILYGNYIVKHHASIRDVAKAYGVGKSGVHTAVTVHLMNVDPQLHNKVRKILNVNKSISQKKHS